MKPRLRLKPLSDKPNGSQSDTMNICSTFSRSLGRRFFDTSLRVKMVLLFLVVALLPIGGLTYINYQTTRTALTTSANHALFAAASQTITHIDGFFTTKLEILANIARVPDIVIYTDPEEGQRENPDLQNKVLQSLLALSDSYVSSCAVLDSKGINLLDTLPVNIGQDESQRLYFQMAVSRRSPHVFPVEFPYQQGASVAFYLSGPIYRAGEIIGVLRMRYNVAIFQQIISNSSGLVGEQSHAILLDEHHLILAYSGVPELLFKLLMPLKPNHMRELQEARRLPNLPADDLSLNLPMFEQGLTHAASYPFFIARTHPGVEQLDQVAVVKLKTQPWIVAFVQPQKEFLAPVNTQTYAALGLALVIVVIVITLAIGVARLLTAPITYLTSVAEQIATGDLTTRVSLETYDEIGQLGRAFDNMTLKLRQTLEALKRHRHHLKELVKERTRELEQEIVERKRAEHAALEAKQAALEAKQAAEEASLAKSEFLANMSHELRTPLNGILGYTQLLRRDTTLTDQQQMSIDIVHRSGEHLLLLIDDLLDLSKIEARKMELEPSEVNLPEFLSGVAEIARIPAEQKGIVLQIEIDAELPLVVSADEQRLRQVLLNLLSNAVKFTEKGHVTFEILDLGFEILDSEKKGQSKICNLKFKISDTGLGVPPEKLETIFHPFEQVRSMRSITEGTGLGLAISQTLVRMMGSELHVTSTVGQGSTFWFDLELPVIDMPTRDGRPFDSAQAKLKSDPTFRGGLHLASGPQPRRRIVGYKGNTRTILLADDKSENRVLLLNMLAPLSFDMIEAVNGQDALDKAWACHPDLLLLDLVMPVLDGFEVIRRIRQFPEPLKNISIVSVSASVFQHTQQESMTAGANDFLTKPVRLDDLLEKIRYYLNLEWVYEETISNFRSPLLGGGRGGYNSQSAIPNSPSEIISPNKKELDELYQLARIGDLASLQERLQELTAADPALAAFETSIMSLANDVRLDEIEYLLQHYLAEEE